MNKKEIIKAISEKAQMPNETAGKALEAITDVIKEELASGRKVQIVGFGVFEVSERAARKGRNPQTGEEINVPATRAPRFKAGKELKAAVKA